MTVHQLVIILAFVGGVVAGFVWALSRWCAPASKQDLHNTENRIEMKLSEIKTQVAAAALRSSEAFEELGTRIADLQKQIDDLIAGASDPDITDQEFLSNLNTVKTNVDALADIVPGP